MERDKIRAYLELFGLSESFNKNELKEAYRDLAHVWHPDKYYHNERLKEKAELKFREINEGYKFLRDLLENGRFSFNNEERFKEDTLHSHEDYTKDGHTETENSRKKRPYIERFKNSEKLTNWVRYFLYIQIAVALVSMASGYMEYQLLSDYQNGVYTSQEKAVADGEANDQRQGTIALLYMVVFIVSGILILKWIYRANYNARQLGAKEMQFTPGWSIGWYFVPIATLWKPYQAMKEIWKASHSPNDWSNASVSSILPWWWFFWLANNFFGQAVLRMSLKANEIDELMNVNLVNQASDIVSIPLALITLALVNNIYKAQISHAGTSS